MDRITEQDLILPALFLMSMQPDGIISTSKLIRELEMLMKPTGIDMQILAGRQDTRFSQIVRNLKSHRTFEKDGYAENVDRGFRITPIGKRLVEAKQDVLRYMFGTPIFSSTEILSSCNDLLQSDTRRKVIPLTEIIQEGITSRRETTIRERSTLLRDAAREYYANKEDGLLYCNCCNFEFGHFYNPELFSSCIEIHHLKPLYQYEDEDMNRTIENALQNLIPVCPNCHRVIHKHHIGIDNFQTFKENLHYFLYES